MTLTTPGRRREHSRAYARSPPSDREPADAPRPALTPPRDCVVRLQRTPGRRGTTRRQHPERCPTQNRKNSAARLTDSPVIAVRRHAYTRRRAQSIAGHCTNLGRCVSPETDGYTLVHGRNTAETHTKSRLTHPAQTQTGPNSAFGHACTSPGLCAPVLRRSDEVENRVQIAISLLVGHPTEHPRPPAASPPRRPPQPTSSTHDRGIEAPYYVTAAQKHRDDAARRARRRAHCTAKCGITPANQPRPPSNRLSQDALHSRTPHTKPSVATTRSQNRSASPNSWLVQPPPTSARSPGPAPHRTAGQQAAPYFSSPSPCVRPPPAPPGRVRGAACLAHARAAARRQTRPYLGHPCTDRAQTASPETHWTAGIDCTTLPVAIRRSQNRSRARFHCICARRPLPPALSPVHRVRPPCSGFPVSSTDCTSLLERIASREDAFEDSQSRASCPCARLHPDTRPAVSRPSPGRSSLNQLHSDALNGPHRVHHMARRSSMVSKPLSRADFIALVPRRDFRPLSRLRITSSHLATTCAVVLRASSFSPNRPRATEPRSKIAPCQCARPCPTLDGAYLRQSAADGRHLRCAGIRRPARIHCTHSHVAHSKSQNRSGGATSCI